MLRELSLRISRKMLLILNITFIQVSTLLLSVICWYFLQDSECKGVILSFPSLLKNFHLHRPFPAYLWLSQGSWCTAKATCPAESSWKLSNKMRSASVTAPTPLQLHFKLNSTQCLSWIWHTITFSSLEQNSLLFSLYNSLLFTALPLEHLKMLSQMIRTINLPLPLQDQELQCLKLIRETWQSNSVLIRKPIPMFWSRTELLFACKRNTNMWC